MLGMKEDHTDAIRERLNEQQRQIDYLTNRLREMAAHQAEMAQNMVAQAKLVAKALGVTL